MVTRGLRTGRPLKGGPTEARVQEISEQTETPCLAGGGACCREHSNLRARLPAPAPRRPCSPTRGSGAHSGGPRSPHLSNGRADGRSGELRRRGVSQRPEGPASIGDHCHRPHGHPHPGPPRAGAAARRADGPAGRAHGAEGCSAQRALRGAVPRGRRRLPSPRAHLTRDRDGTSPRPLPWSLPGPVTAASVAPCDF